MHAPRGPTREPRADGAQDCSLQAVMCAVRLQVDAANPRPAHRWKRLEETVSASVKDYFKPTYGVFKPRL